MTAEAANSPTTPPKMTQPGTRLGHYTTAAAAFEGILPKHRLQLSPYSRMRDPAENRNLTPIISYFVDPQAEQEQQQIRTVRYTWLGIAGSEASIMVDPRIFDDATREEAVLDYMKLHYGDLFFLKSDDWRTEYEFRALLAESDKEHASADYGDALQAVVLGEQFPDWQVAGAQKTCEAAGVELQRVRWHNGRPHLGKLSRTPRNK